MYNYLSRSDSVTMRAQNCVKRNFTLKPKAEIGTSTNSDAQKKSWKAKKVIASLKDEKKKKFKKIFGFSFFLSKSIEKIEAKNLRW